MHHRHIQLWQTPHRLSSTWTKVLGGLALVILVIAASGLVLYEGWPRIVHVSALGLVGITNLAWVLGSILPEARGGKALRVAMLPLSLLMGVALLASVTSHGGGGISGYLIGAISGLGAVVALRRTKQL